MASGMLLYVQGDPALFSRLLLLSTGWCRYCCTARCLSVRGRITRLSFDWYRRKDLYGYVSIIKRLFKQQLP